MVITKVTASFNQTIQVKQFEPVNIAVSAECELSADDQDKVDEAYNLLLKLCKKHVSRRISKIKALKSKTIAGKMTTSY